MDGKPIDLDAIEARAETLCTDGADAVEAVAVFRADVFALLDKVDELRGALTEAEEANRGMRAMEHRYRRMADRYRNVADRYRRMADRYRDVVDQYRQENAELVTQLQRAAMGESGPAPAVDSRSTDQGEHHV